MAEEPFTTATGLDVQRALVARGFNIGPSGVDGDPGPRTFGAVMRALQQIPLAPLAAPAIISKPAGVVPMEWIPWCKMQRIIVHWTAGAHTASANDVEHYHVLIEGDGTLRRGKLSIADNVSAADGKYVAHTKDCNTGSIGVSLCAMRGAKESPFNAGPSPITKAQWDILPLVLADLCRRYAINPSPTTLLSHAEVERTLGIKQRGKWDIARLPFGSAQTATTIGNQFRDATKALL